MKYAIQISSQISSEPDSSDMLELQSILVKHNVEYDNFENMVKTIWSSDYFAELVNRSDYLNGENLSDVLNTIISNGMKFERAFIYDEAGFSDVNLDTGEEVDYETFEAFVVLDEKDFVVLKMIHPDYIGSNECPCVRSDQNITASFSSEPFFFDYNQLEFFS